jgi:hypothetical protein
MRMWGVVQLNRPNADSDQLARRSRYFRPVAALMIAFAGIGTLSVASRVGL